MTDPYLTLQDLRARGWSLGMIQALLGAHDHERWTNKLGHQVSKPVKLFLTTRVVQLEATEAFTRARERACAQGVLMRQVAQTRRAWEAQAAARYEALALPAVQVQRFKVEGHPEDIEQLWQVHLREFYRWQRQQEQVLSGVTQARRRGAQQRMLQRYQAAVNQAYGWSESSH
ncbi:hypothetical protein [Deinococcus aquatilis]|uniref:hypothetical protein n=1 Tax=Deinococcus aquatilis TaxID=519440 RepID=UPI0003671E2F|nr:hypothetical protein [Deinococcus aquatilis]